VENWRRCSCTNGKQAQISIRKWKGRTGWNVPEKQNISDDSFDEQYKKRVECEKIHGQIKNTLNSISEAGETRV